MSIAKRVAEAVKRMCEGDWEAALIPASIAIDATAKREFPHAKNEERYKQFLEQNQDVIMLVATKGGFVLLGGSTISLNCTIGGRQCSSVSDVLYNVVRCNLLHEAGLPANMALTEDRPLHIELSGSSFSASSSLVDGLLVAVVASPANRDEPFRDDLAFTWYGQTIRFNEFRGQRGKLDAVLSRGLWVRAGQKLPPFLPGNLSCSSASEK